MQEKGMGKQFEQTLYAFTYILWQNVIIFFTK